MSKAQGPESVPEIRGNTLRVYLYILQHGPCELKEVQNALEFSTASLASYHLRRLMDAGYASQDEFGRYLASKDNTMQILEGYVRVGVVVVPQLLFFSVLFTALVGFFAYMALASTSYLPFLVTTSLALVAVVWYETFRVWRRLSSWR